MVLNLSTVAIMVLSWSDCFLVSSWSLKVTLPWSLELASRKGLVVDRASMGPDKSSVIFVEMDVVT